MEIDKLTNELLKNLKDFIKENDIEIDNIKELNVDTRLIGKNSFFDSMDLVTFIVEIEEYIIDNMLYAIELMKDNHKELCERLGVPVDHKHYVCANALEYDYSFGEPVGVEAFFT